MATTSLEFDVTVRGHVYHAKIQDNREHRRYQQACGYDRRNLISPYYFEAMTSEEVEDASLCSVYSYDCYSKPSKKEIKDAIEHQWQKYESAKRQAEAEAIRRRDEEERKEQQRIAHELWLDEPAQLTNRDVEKIMSRLQSLEARLKHLSSDVEEMDSQVRGVRYSVYGPGLEE